MNVHSLNIFPLDFPLTSSSYHLIVKAQHTYTLVNSFSKYIIVDLQEKDFRIDPLLGRAH